jgi:EamA domain-containing membrane protein RarD
MTLQTFKYLNIKRAINVSRVKMKTMLLFVCLAIAIAIPLIQGSCSTAPVKIRQTGRLKYIGMLCFVCTPFIIMHVIPSYFVFSFALCRFIHVSKMPILTYQLANDKKERKKKK